MFEFMPDSSGKAVGVRAVGRLTDADYKQTLIPKLEDLFKQYGELNVLFYLGPDFEGWDLEAAWDDASYGLKHRADFGKLALVGGPAWAQWTIKLSAFLMKGEIKIFPADQLAEAWAWVKE
jgi:hypothetical protein